MKKFILREYTGHFWGIYDLEEYVDGDLVKTTSINRFVEVTPEFVIEFEPEGGSGIGYRPGAMIKKIFIGNAEFEHVKQHSKSYQTFS